MWNLQSSKDLNLKMRLFSGDSSKFPTQLTILKMQYKDIPEIT